MEGPPVKRQRSPKYIVLSSDDEDAAPAGEPACANDAALARRLQEREHIKGRLAAEEAATRRFLERERDLRRIESAGSHGPAAASPSSATVSVTHSAGHGQRSAVGRTSQQPVLDTRTDGLVELLKDQYRLPAGKYAKRATAAVCELCPHFTQKGIEGRVQGTRTWSCGYRNTQMLCAALLAGCNGREFQRVLFDGAGAVPDVGCLQIWIERAWASGWDAAAQQTFAGGRLRDTSHWIGACEVWALLRSFGLQPIVVDFRPTTLNDLSDEAVRQRLVDWIWRYFTSPDPPDPSLQDAARPWRRHCAHAKSQQGTALDQTANLSCEIGGLQNHGLLTPYRDQDHHPTDFSESADASTVGAQRRTSRYRPPLYLQHDGHSRTVVGIERRVDGVRAMKVTWNLLIWDPLTQGTQLRRAFAAGAAAAAGTKRRTVHGNGNPPLNRGSSSRSVCNNGWQTVSKWESMVKRGVHTLKKSQYQVLYVPPTVLTVPGRAQAFKGVACAP